jgi:broad specificity phosphatase PhoE/GNAT superfamily N-acetyltransferase
MPVRLPAGWLFGNCRGERGYVVFLTGKYPSKTPQLPPYHGESQRPSRVLRGIISFSDKIVPVTEFWLVRHGQTDWNVEGRYQGQSDIPLNPTGLEQARRLAQSLNGLSFDAIYSSDLARAHQTALEIARVVGKPVYVDRRLREICQGEWEGQKLEEIKANFGRIAPQSPRDPLNDRAPGGESTLEVAQRVAQCAMEIADQQPYGKILIVSHGFALATLICQAHGIPLERVYTRIPDNAAPEVIAWPPVKQPEELAGKLEIRPFCPEDQAEAQALILGGLKEHWGSIDPTKNPDIYDISTAYRDAFFFVARHQGRMVGTAALIPRDEHTAEIVRMSVSGDLRRKGIGKALLHHLVNLAKQSDYCRLILETTSSWENAVQFYLENGFKVTHQRDGDTYFTLILKDQASSLKSI